jgi:hypothetical protein
MKKQMVSLVFILSAVLFLSLPNLVFADSAGLPLVYGSAWEYGSDGLWQSRLLTMAELSLISDGDSSTHIEKLSSSIYRRPDTSAEILAPWVVVAFDASRLTNPTEALTLKVSAYTINNIISGTDGSTYSFGDNNAYIYGFAADNWVGQDPSNPTINANWVGYYGPWDTASSPDSPTYGVNRYQGRDLSPDNLIWLRIGSAASTSGGYPLDSVATFNLTLNEISLSGDITPVPLPPSLLLFASGFLGLAGWRRLRKT